jgi:hypothetical protein
MKHALAVALVAAVPTVASASFVEYYTQMTTVTEPSSGTAVDVYVLFARFDGATDTVLNAYNLTGLAGSTLNAFYHKDNANSGVLTTSAGTWNPSQTGNATSNRPFDSYVTIGGLPTNTNTTNADPSWGAALSWNRPDLPNGQNIGWFNSNPPNTQGRVGGAGNTADSVRLGQFVVASGFNAGTISLKFAYNNGVAGSPVQFAESTFTLPAPGAIALLGLAGLAGRRRR